MADLTGGAVLVAVLVLDVLFVDFPGGVIFVDSSGRLLVVALGLLGAATSVMRRVWPLGTVLALGLATVGVDVWAGVTARPIVLSYATSLGGVTLLYNAGRWAPPKNRGLRVEDDIPRPLPGFGDIQHLASELSNENLEISVEIDTQPEMIPVSVSAAAFWITREALTNVIRHATSATQAHVHTRSTHRHLDLTITDNGATPNTPVSDRGHGLSSMTARAKALGGDLSAGPNPNGGRLVATRFPLNLPDT